MRTLDLNGHPWPWQFTRTRVPRASCVTASASIRAPPRTSRPRRVTTGNGLSSAGPERLDACGAIAVPVCEKPPGVALGGSVTVTVVETWFVAPRSSVTCRLTV